jgi:hypothetical protein
VEKRYGDMLAQQLRGSAEVVVCGPADGSASASPRSPGASGGAGTQSGAAIRAQRDRLAAGLIRHLREASYTLPLRIAGQLWRARRHRTYAEVMIDQAKPQAIVLFEDNIGDVTRFFGAAAARRNIPYIVLPTTIPNPREPANVLQGWRTHAVTGLAARAVARRWPEWVHELDGRQLLRLPVPAILALKSVRADIPTPWILNSGHARFICVESRATRSIYRRLGFEDERLALTGSPVDDTLHSVHCERAQRRQALLDSLGADPRRLLLLVAFPPDQYAAPTTEFEYSSFDDLVDGWLRALAPLAGAVNIVVRPHPRLDRVKLAAFEKAGCRVVMHPTEQLVPLADVYIACISATIRWALALGIPVINYDCYRYRYQDYKDARGMLLAEDQGIFASLVQRISTDAAFRQTLRERQAADSGCWGDIDGRFAARFAATLRELLEPADPIP